MSPTLACTFKRNYKNNKIKKFQIKKLCIFARSTFEMGVEKEVITEGTGPTPSKGQTITVHCTGYLAEPTQRKFWSTHDTDTPFSFQVGLGKVIRGWDEGCLTMKKGEKARLKMTGDYAYGAGGFPHWGIGPNAPLIFEIEILEIKN
jgi:peptidylprolyl isomerase